MAVDSPEQAAVLSPSSYEPHHDFLHAVSEEFARRHLVLGVVLHGEPRLLTSTNTRPSIPHNCCVHLDVAWHIETIDAEALARAIDTAYSTVTPVANVDAGDDDGIDEHANEVVRLLDEDKDLLHTHGKGPVIRLVDALLFEAIGRGASDLHIQPTAVATLVRTRVDGALHTVRRLPPGLAKAIASRIKVMGRMDVAEHRLPQDGRTTATIGGSSGTAGSQPRTIDMRISTMPTAHGERAVLRLLEGDTAEQLGDFAQLGMPAPIGESFMEAASRSSGIVLSTGPTGSGKTTTLYTTLRWIASSSAADLNVMTIEDPIEYELSSEDVAISQAQVNTKKGVTFATGLRHILRQDPDVIMVGEIRDEETARTAIQASLTGHVVFSTLHTNDAATAVTRLVDLGVEPYLVSASLSAVLAQRLVRRVHAECDGRGCEGCLRTGYRGRVGVFEFLLVDDAIRRVIGGGGDAGRIRELACDTGMRTLYEAGMDLVRLGITTEAEVQRVSGASKTAHVVENEA
ncbi:MAG: GspE/PulE family protein [Planctomycetota bacterium]